MTETLKYERTPDGVHVWRYSSGQVFCAASSPTDKREDTPCFPLAKQYVGSSVTPDPLPVSAADGIALAIPSTTQFVLLLMAVSALVVGLVAATYRTNPPQATDDLDDRYYSAPIISGDGASVEPEPIPVEIAEPLANSGSSGANGSETVREPFANSSGSERIPVRGGDLSSADFKRLYPPGSLDVRLLSLQATRDAAMSKLFDLLVRGGSSLSTEKLAWLLFGVSKGGEKGTPRRELWDMASAFVLSVKNHVDQYGCLPTQTNLF